MINKFIFIIVNPNFIVMIPQSHCIICKLVAPSPPPPTGSCGYWISWLSFRHAINIILACHSVPKPFFYVCYTPFKLAKKQWMSSTVRPLFIHCSSTSTSVWKVPGICGKKSPGWTVDEQWMKYVLDGLGWTPNAHGCKPYRNRKSCNNIVSARYRLYNVCTDGMDIDNLAYIHAYAMHGHAHVLTAAIGILPI